MPSKRFATLDEEESMTAVLKVVGVGGGGCNAIQYMMKKGLSGVQYVAVNTDAQVLEENDADVKVQIGRNLTKGLGAGADPNVGKKAAEEDREAITKFLEGSDMVFITAGMGGGTGTGAAPFIASVAKSLDALVVGIVTKPFKWEGKKRMMNAEKGIQELRQHVDSLIIIPNVRLLSLLDSNVSAFDTFDKPNEVLLEATKGIADIITIPGRINVDFADVRSVMSASGEALMGCGWATGENRAVEAAQKAISSPLLEGVSIRGAKNLLVNVTGSKNLTMQEIDAGNNIIFDAAGEEANVIFGMVNKEEMEDAVSYTVIATGFDSGQSSSSQVKNNQTQVSTGTSAPSIQQMPKQQQGGYVRPAPVKNQPAASDDLDTPTIFRVSRPDSSILESDFMSKGGFKVERQASLFDETEPEKRENDYRDEDSSSFLRMMMD